MVTETLAERVGNVVRGLTGRDPTDAVDESCEREERDAERQACQLSMYARGRRGRDLGNIRVDLVSYITSGNMLLYLESLCTSDPVAHALCAALDMASDGDHDISWTLHTPTDDDPYRAMSLRSPVNPSVRDVRLALPGTNQIVRHVAAIDRSGSLVIVDRGATLWKKLRALLTTPTLEQWGETLLPEITRRGVVKRCESRGLPQDMYAYVLADDAQAQFDAIVGEHVRARGLRA